MKTLAIGQLFTALSMSSLLFACGGDSSTSGSGTLSVNVTDAPVDSAAKVVVAFSGITIKPEQGPAVEIDFVDDNGDTVIKTVDLLAQQGPNSEPILVNHILDAGRYNWMRLKLVEGPASMQSYIELDDGSQHPLYVPSGFETGLKLVRGFEIADGGAINFTIDFDLRKSVLAPNINSTEYKLKPTLRIVDNQNVGHIAGAIGSVTLNDASCTKTDYAVYVFAGDNVVVDDIDGIEPDPIATSLVSDAFEYAVGFLEEGSYTLAFTCQAADDDSEQDDIIDFIGTDSVTVNAGSTTTFDFE